MKCLITLLILPSAASAAEFTISVTDAATRQPVAARVYVENAGTGMRYFVRAHSKLDGVVYEKKNWAPHTIPMMNNAKRGMITANSAPACPFWECFWCAQRS